MASLEYRDVLPSSLIDTINSTSELSTLYSFVSQSAKLFNLFNESEGFTFLAPTNAAFSTWFADQTTTPTLDVVEAYMEYHLLNGSFPTISFTNESQFAPTYLQNVSYSNVTIPPGGQRVELVNGASGQPEFLSDNKTVTDIATKDVICLGGLIQIVNSILSIPTSVVTLTAQANMAYFIAILNRANFLSVNDSGLIDFVNTASFTPNLTFFVPNSAEALTKFTNVSVNLDADNLMALFNYHIVPDFVGYSSNLTNGTRLKTLQGDNVTVTRDGDDIFVNSARITEPDYLVVNGVIHVIDTLLDRNNQTIPAQVLNSTTTSTNLPSNATSTSPSSPTSSSSHSGVSKGTKIGVGVAIPIVVIAAVAGFLFWFLRRRKGKAVPEEPPQELGADPGMRELGGGAPVGKEMDATERRKELFAGQPPTELGTPYHERQPVELE